MKVSLSWLREFVPYEGTVEALADRLTMLGLEVDAISHPFAAVQAVVVGHVVDCQRHPEADKLSVCKVDVGREVLDIVCGAPNVAQGQKVPVAGIGAVLPGGLEIKKAKIRGAASHGMICSARELGLSADHSGIMVLDPAARPGAPFVDALGLETAVLDIDLTPNRADCLSHLGVAREVAMSFDLPLTLPRVTVAEAEERAADLVRIVIDDATGCPLYQARVLKGLRVGPSPEWMRYRLMAVGVRPISNVVDATNYVLMELGHPLHAFDLARLEGEIIRVARAGEGQTFTTLDNQERKLVAQDLLIWDGAKPVALAGVMGGANSEVSAATVDVLLECAVFQPGSIRKTARRLSLPSEASHRFERGVDHGRARLAVDRAAQLMAQVAGGRILAGVAVAEPKPWVQPVVPFRPQRAGLILGLPVDVKFCAKTLSGLGCRLEGETGAQWTVYPPSHRLDLEREIDLVEEIGRVYGVDKIPTALPRVARETAETGGTAFDFLFRLKRWGRGVGLRECINYSFCGSRDLDGLGLPQEGRVAVANPLSEEQNVMRTALAPGLLANLRLNVAQGSPDLRLFEVARTFHADAASQTTVRERLTLALLVHGARFAGAYPWPREESDFSDAKGLVEDLLRHLGLPAATYALATDHPYLEPVVAVGLMGRELGIMGRLRPAMAEQYKARRDVWLAELDAELLRELTTGQRTAFRDLPKFPPVRRDITLLAAPETTVEAILAAVRGARASILEDVVLIDVYQPEGQLQRNLTFRLTYRHPDKTLKDKDVDKVHSAIAAELTRSLPVQLQA